MTLCVGKITVLKVQCLVSKVQSTSRSATEVLRGDMAQNGKNKVEVAFSA